MLGVRPTSPPPPSAFCPLPSAFRGSCAWRPLRIPVAIPPTQWPIQTQEPATTQYRSTGKTKGPNPQSERGPQPDLQVCGPSPCKRHTLIQAGPPRPKSGQCLKKCGDFISRTAVTLRLLTYLPFDALPDIFYAARFTVVCLDVTALKVQDAVCGKTYRCLSEPAHPGSQVLHRCWSRCSGRSSR